jgi:N-acetylmuramoyl-L-alanine amidase
MPFTIIKSEECIKAIEQLTAFNDKSYHCNIEAVTKPIKGLQCTVTYNPSIIGFEYEPYMQQGIMFKFIHKEKLKQLHDDRFNPITRLALSDHKPHIMIDIGHGDRDIGATNAEHGIQEKDINRSIGLKVAALLRKKGYNVFLTRTKDTFVPLNERTTMANNNNADLFISIHANSAPNTNASGIETYYSPSTEQSPNRFHLSINEIDSFNKFMKNKTEYSKILAHHIHQHVIAYAQKYQKDVRDRNVKSAPFQVLSGEMPATLVEVGFISHPEEGPLLALMDYQNLLARGIYKGVITHIETMKSKHATALTTSVPEHVQAS